MAIPPSQVPWQATEVAHRCGGEPPLCLPNRLGWLSISPPPHLGPSLIPRAPGPDGGAAGGGGGAAVHPGGRLRLHGGGGAAGADRPGPWHAQGCTGIPATPWVVGGG